MAAEVQRAPLIAAQILNPPQHTQWDFSFSDFLKREYRFGLDPNRPTCKAFLQGHCPAGSNCPDKHDFKPTHNSLVCKHWLRGLCKKGDACEYIHEYNLRRMPECNHYSRYGACPNGDECLYLHIEPDARRPPCPHYDRGFCPLGPRCANKHMRRERICPFYLAGFCPSGKECNEGAHARFPTDLQKPEVRIEKSREQLDQERLEREEELRKEEERQRELEERYLAQGGDRGRGGFKRRGRWGKGNRGQRRQF